MGLGRATGQETLGECIACVYTTMYYMCTKFGGLGTCTDRDMRQGRVKNAKIHPLLVHIIVFPFLLAYLSYSIVFRVPKNISVPTSTFLELHILSEACVVP